MKKHGCFGKGKKMGKPGTKPPMLNDFLPRGKRSAHKPLEESIQDISDNINKHHERAEQAEGKSTLYAIKTGQYLLKLKLAVKGKIGKDGKKEKFGDYMAQHFPHIHPKTYQRYMNIAKHLSEKEADLLSILGQARILALIAAVKKENVAVFEYIEKEGIEIPGDLDDEDEDVARDFKAEVDKILSKGKKVKPSPSPGSKDPDYDEDSDEDEDDDDEDDSDDDEDDDDEDDSDDDEDDDNDDEDDDDEDDDDDLDDDDEDDGEEDELPEDPLDTIIEINKKGIVFNTLVDHLKGQKRRLRKAPVEARHGRMLKQLIKRLEANIEELRALRESLNA